jgi:hypothetical protein
LLMMLTCSPEHLQVLARFGGEFSLLPCLLSLTHRDGYHK